MANRFVIPDLGYIVWLPQSVGALYLWAKRCSSFQSPAYGEIASCPWLSRLPECPVPHYSNNMMAAFDDSSNWLILNLYPLQTIVELACERVVTTRVEFNFSWFYTFSATPGPLQIWAPVPPSETGCNPALPAQLCWSSDSFFPHIRNTSIWTWFVIEIIHQSRTR